MGILRLTNTASGRLEEVKPERPGELRIYECGPTVYDAAHIGHARPMVVFDVLARHLEKRGLKVVHVKNITDIEDKIIKRAAEQGVSCPDLTKKWEADYWELSDRMGVRRPQVAPRATDHVGAMLDFIRALEAKGLAYKAGDGVYFPVRKFPDYGRLSRRDLEGMRSESEEGTGKNDPLDFALWKFEKPGEPAWDSPWGRGRPGWHIECSAMSTTYLDAPFDIHGGALDLIFPHHENEIAQSEGALGRPFVRVWMHVGFINVGGQKMSKSLGNVVSLRSLLDRHGPDVLRLYLLQTHYRSPMDFEEARLRESAAALERLANYKLHHRKFEGGTASAPKGKGELAAQVDEAWAGFQEAMDEDLNTAKALGGLFTMINHCNHGAASPSGETLEALRRGYAVYSEAMAVLGLLRSVGEAAIPAPVQALAAERDKARAAKDFASSDRLRKEIENLGYAVEDSKGQGTLLKPLRAGG